MTLRVMLNLVQGSDEWHDARRGMVTASSVGQLLTTATLAPANNETSRTLTRLLVAERITGYTDPTYRSDDMWRGVEEEPRARDHYSGHHGEAIECGFMVRDDWGFHIGYSPDGLVGDDGLIEVKAPRQKEQVRTVLADEVPTAYMPQLQCALLVSGRSWIDYVSFCGGMPMYVTRVLPDPEWHEAIVAAVARFEEVAAVMTADYAARTEGLPLTERLPEFGEVELKL